MKINSVNMVNAQEQAAENRSATVEDERLKKACADFEGILLGCMLKSMRSTLSGDALFGGGLQKDIYDSMYDQQLAENIAGGKNSLGIGAALYRQLKEPE